ncbi:MAG: hypothetical protein ACRYGP_32865 [Janthinobacterium lividum]
MDQRVSHALELGQHVCRHIFIVDLDQVSSSMREAQVDIATANQVPHSIEQLFAVKSHRDKPSPLFSLPHQHTRSTVLANDLDRGRRKRFMDGGQIPPRVHRQLGRKPDAGGTFGQVFLSRLTNAAGSHPHSCWGKLRALSIDAVRDHLGRLRFTDLLAAAGQDPVEHRAGSDSLRLLRAGATGADRTPSVVVDVD